MFALPVRYDNIRELPYPYKSLIAISSDADYMNLETLNWLIKFLNTSEQTPLGNGLDLEFASSIFFYSNSPLHLCVFDGLKSNSPLSKNAILLSEYIRYGYIDTNHAFGDFNSDNLFNRKHAIRTYEFLDKHSLHIPVFSNHGNGNLEAMRQNVGFLPYHQGNNKSSAAYHVDLFKANGGRYIWTDDWVDELKVSIGLDGATQYNNDGRQLGGGPIMQKLSFEDTYYWFFRRYRSTGIVPPNFQNFNYQIQTLNWEWCYNHAAVIIIYQHLGVFGMQKQCIPTTLELLKKNPYYLQGFYFLKEEMQKGNLMVLSTYNLLRYVEMYLTTKVDCSIGENNEYIYIINNYEHRELDFFNGLTIYIENPKFPLKAKYLDADLKFIMNGPDNRGRYSITINSKE